MGSIPSGKRRLRGHEAKSGDGEIPRQAVLRSAGGLTGRDGRKGGVFMQQLVAQMNPSQGVRAFGSLNLALVGSFHLATGGTGATSSGVRAKNPAMKSSTMKGAKALGSKL